MSIEPDQATKPSLDKDQLKLLKSAAGSGPVLILTHDNPDPDALASGKGLAALLERAWDIPSQLVYSGTVARADNRAMLALLTPEWEHQETLDELDAYSALALVDTQPGAGNNRLPTHCQPRIVFDHHHPIRETIRTIPFVEVRPEVGATTTLVFKYMRAAGIQPDRILAAAMFYGIKTDTRGLSRGVSPIDEIAYLKLLSRLDHQALLQVEYAGLDRDHFRAIARGLNLARLYGHAIVARLGAMDWPDQGAEISDLLIRYDGAQAVLCLGEHEDTLHISIRTKTMEQDAGEIIQQVIVPSGRAGGHGSMAGGQVPLSSQSAEQVMDELESRFLRVMGEAGAGAPFL